MQIHTFILYLVESSLLPAIAYLFYRYLFFKLAYFEWTRFFFWAMAIAGFVLPLLPLPTNENGENTILKSTYLIDFYNTTAFVNAANEKQFSLFVFLESLCFFETLFAVWLLFFLKNGLALGKGLWQVGQLKKKYPKENNKGYTLVKVKGGETAYSFFNTFFLSEAFYELDTVQKGQILKHEKIHADSLHSLDNLFFSLISALFWFNPLVRKLLSAVRENHEFSVDSQLTGGKIQKDYSMLIVHLASQNPIFKSISAFSDGNIRHRILLLTNPESEQLRKKRFLFTLPVVAVLMFVFYFFTAAINSFNKPESKHKKENVIFEAGTYQLISPFFENKKTKQGKVSHRELTYSLKDNSPIFAVGNGQILRIDTTDNWGVPELTIHLKVSKHKVCIYKSLYQAVVKLGDTVPKGKQIGISGDSRLYPSVSFQLIERGVAVNPRAILRAK